MGIKNTPKKAGEKKAENKLSKKSKTPMKHKKPQKINDNAVNALKEASVKVATDNEALMKKAQDARTLYVRFSEKFPPSVEHIQELHPDIKFVRAPRLATKKGGKDGIRFAFVEFNDEEACKSAKTKLDATQYKGKELFVDFVGEKSKKKKTGGVQELNPTRLFVVGLAPGVSKNNLKEMFPKAGHAEIPQKSKKKGTSFGFVQFSNAADAKAAFDAAQDLSVNGHKITVLYAKTTENKKDVQKKKAEKRKAKKVEKEEDSGEKKSKVAKETEEDESEDEDDEKDDLEDTVEEKKEDSHEDSDDDEDGDNQDDKADENDEEDDEDESDGEDQKESLVLNEAEEDDDDDDEDDEEDDENEDEKESADDDDDDEED